MEALARAQPLLDDPVAAAVGVVEGVQPEAALLVAVLDDHLGAAEPRRDGHALALARLQEGELVLELVALGRRAAAVVRREAARPQPVKVRAVPALGAPRPPAEGDEAVDGQRARRLRAAAPLRCVGRRGAASHGRPQSSRPDLARGVISRS